MINYRTIFNPSYNYVGIIFIIALALLIVIIQKDTIESLYQISKIGFISGILTLILGLIINIVINNLIPNNYKIFIQVITDNLIGNLIFTSLLVALISGSINLIIKIITHKSKNKKEPHKINV